MKKKSILFTILSLTLLSGCSTSNITQKEIKNSVNTFNIIKTSQVPADYLEYSEGEKESFYYHSDTVSKVEEFKTEYKKLTDEEAPEFNGIMIIAKSGAKSSGGHTISVESVKESGRYTEVTILSQSPGVGCLVTLGLENPYIVVEIPNDHKDVKFVEKNIKVDCK